MRLTGRRVDAQKKSEELVENIKTEVVCCIRMIKEKTTKDMTLFDALVEITYDDLIHIPTLIIESLWHTISDSHENANEALSKLNNFSNDPSRTMERDHRIIDKCLLEWESGFHDPLLTRHELHLKSMELVVSSVHWKDEERVLVEDSMVELFSSRYFTGRDSSSGDPSPLEEDELHLVDELLKPSLIQ